MNKTLTPEQTLHFQAWRATALQSMPYFASLLFSFRPVATDMVDTFAIDPGHRVYINFDNCIPKGPTFCAEGLLHEAGHILGEHAVLAKISGVTDEERKAWNLAGDFAINDDLRDAGCSELANHGVFAAMINEPDFKDPLYYMESIRKLQKKQPKPQPGKGDSESGGSGGDQDDQSGQDDDTQGQSQGSAEPMKGCGSGAGGERGDFELGDDDDMGGTAPAATATEKEVVRIRTAAEIREHQNQKGIGSVPGGIASVADQIMTPSKTPWERVLASFVRRCVAHTAGHFDTTYTRRNRRRMNETMRNSSGRILGRVIVPGSIRPVPSVHFYRDTSLSVSDRELAMASAEVVSIARRLGIRGENLVVTDVDTQVYESVKYQNAKSVQTVTGRGGTNMIAAIEHACDLPTQPSCIVIATDGGTPWPTERPTVPVIVLLIQQTGNTWAENMRSAIPEWAHVVELDSAS